MTPQPFICLGSTQSHSSESHMLLCDLGNKEDALEFEAHRLRNTNLGYPSFSEVQRD